MVFSQRYVLGAKKRMRKRRPAKKGLKHKVAKLSKKVAANAPEMKTQQLSLIGANYLHTRYARSATVLSNITSGVSRGTAARNQIVGNECTMHACDFKMTIEKGDSGTNYVRAIVFEVHGETPASAADLLEITLTNTSGYVDYVVSPYNQDKVYSKRVDGGTWASSSKPYKILKDWIVPVGSSSPDVLIINHTFKWPKGFKLRQIGTTTTMAQRNEVYLAVFPRYSTTAGDNPYISAQAQMYITDA